MSGRNGGRKPLPEELKVLRGTARRDRKRESSKGIPVDKWSSISSTRGIKILQSARAKAIFKAKCNQLILLGILSEADLDQLSFYAYNLDKLYSLMGDLREESDMITLYKVIYRGDGETEKIPTKTIINPKWKLYFSLIDTINKVGSEFGFTPVARQKLKLPEEPKLNPIEELKRQLNG